MKKAIQSIVDYLLFGNIYIALCAVFLTIETYRQFQLKPDPSLVGLIFFLTVASYNLHAFFDPMLVKSSVRVNWLKKNRKTLLFSMITALIAACFFLSSLNRALVGWFLILSLLTLLYSLPRIFPGTGIYLNYIQKFKVFYLSLMWLTVTVLTPLMLIGKRLDESTIIYIITTYLVILIVCLMFDERSRSLLSINQRISVLKKLDHKASVKMFHMVVLLAVLSIIGNAVINFDFNFILGNSLAVLAAYLVFRSNRKSKGDYWYYSTVDGILLIPGLVITILELGSVC